MRRSTIFIFTNRPLLVCVLFFLCYSGFNFVQAQNDSIYYGCTDTSALNWDSEAIYEDGSCVYDTTFEVYGCTDSDATNYDPLATIDDNTCHYDLDSNVYYGCTDTSALNWDSEAIYEDGSCVYDTTFEVYGCTDSDATNYDPLATIDNNTCQYDLDSNMYYGCTDTSALNWDSEAIYEDGSCVYDTTFEVYGCTDSDATNYDPLATIDNNTCQYDLDSNIYHGCTDTSALNWDSEAIYEDGSCVYDTVLQVYGCTNQYAANYDPFATENDGSCVYKDSVYDYFEDCDFDYSQPIDEGYISSYQILGDSLVIAQWTVVQGQVTSVFEAYYFNFWNGTIECYLYVSCDSSSTWQAKIEQGQSSFTVSDEVDFGLLTHTAEKLGNAQIGLFPQPALNQITVLLPEIFSGAGEVRLTDISGKIVADRQVDLNAFGTEVDLSELESGMYFIEVRQKGEVIASDRLYKE